MTEPSNTVECPECGGEGKIEWETGRYYDGSSKISVEECEDCNEGKATCQVCGEDALVEHTRILTGEVAVIYPAKGRVPPLKTHHNTWDKKVVAELIPLCSQTCLDEWAQDSGIDLAEKPGYAP
jgi:hypothetical protein